MDWHTYTQQAIEPHINPELTQQERILSGILGLCGESGEVADLFKKHYYHGHTLDRDKLTKELGDVLWYWTLLCNTVGISPEEVVALNVAKLNKRYPQGFSTAASVYRPAE